MAKLDTREVISVSVFCYLQLLFIAFTEVDLYLPNEERLVSK